MFKFLLKPKKTTHEKPKSVEHNVSLLGAGGDFETQIEHGNSKPDRTTRRIVTVKPRLRQTAVIASDYFCPINLGLLANFESM